MGFPKIRAVYKSGLWGYYRVYIRDNGKENGSYYLGSRVSQNRGTFFGGPYTKDYGIWGSILGSPYLGKLPNV